MKTTSLSLKRRLQKRSSNLTRVLGEYKGYIVLSSGDILSKRSSKPLKQSRRGNYFKVNICEDGIVYQESVHRVIASFLNNQYQKETVNHIDGDKYNNDISNLEWMTRSENQSHAFSTGLQKGKRTRARPLQFYDKTTGIGEVYPTATSTPLGNNYAKYVGKYYKGMEVTEYVSRSWN